jgi:hypothetical protein
MWTLITDGRRRHLLRSVQLSDLCLFWAALGSYWLWFPETGGAPLPLPLESWRTLAWFIGSSALWHLCLAKADLYRSRRLSAGAGEL